MSVRFSRLGLGDWLIGPASLALLIILFAFPWFGVHANYAKVVGELGATVSANGWRTYTVVGPLTVIVTVLGLACWLMQLTRPTPALGILTTIVLAPLSLLLLIWLLLRVLIFPPSLAFGSAVAGNGLAGKPAAYFAVVLSLLIFIGALVSLRREGGDPADTPGHIETFPLPAGRASAESSR